jgi:Zn-dependent M28 family amino/carboxypeptidase
MRKTAKVATALILIGISVAGAVEIERYCARAAVRAAATGFNGERALSDLCQLVQLGPRPAGSENSERARAYIERQLSADAEIWDDPFVAATPMGKVPMTNVMGIIHGEDPSVVILAGHYDTARIDGVQFLGANDGGSSAALLLEMARVLHRQTNKFTYWLVFFDGEEAFKKWTASDSLYGSRHLSEKLVSDGKLGQIKAMILVDMVADRHLNILRESNSTAWLSDLVFKTARTLGYSKAFSGGMFPVEDDHLPFVARGVPAVDIIDLTPFGSYHHTAQDSIDKCSPESLALVGRVVLATLAELERTG